MIRGPYAIIVGGVCALVVLVVAMGFFRDTSFDPEGLTHYPPRGDVVIAFGDSLVEGVGSNNGGFVSQLEDRFGHAIVNAGVSGDTTSDALRRLEGDVLAHDPDIVLVLLGGNDVLRRVPSERIRLNLSEVIDSLHEEGVFVILLGVRGGLTGSREVDEVFESLALTHRVAYIPDVLEGVWGNTDLMADQIHPNDEGYTVIADRVAPVLKRALEDARLVENR